MRSLILGTCLCVLAVPTASAQANDPARATVQTLDDGLIAIMKAGEAAGISGRSSRISPIINQTFDIPLMTRLAVGTSWNGMSASDHSALVAAFHRLTVIQYARNFDGYSGETITIELQVQSRGNDRLVRTMLRTSGSGSVPIAYRLRQTRGAWRIIDVFYKNSISQLAMRRSDFAGVLAKGGAPALVSHLDQLATKPGS